MKHAFELIQSPGQGEVPATLTRRHPYQTQTEFYLLLHQLVQVEELSRSHDRLLDLVEKVHDADAEVVLASYAIPATGHVLDVPDSAQGRRSELELCTMLLELAQAVSLLHDQGLVHGDIRPETVWVQGGRDAPVYALYAPCLLAVDATLWDSPGWHDHLVRRSPEWLLGPRRSDERTDLYALGVLVFEQLHALPSVSVMMHDLAYYSRQSDVFDQLPHLGRVLANLLEPDHSLRYQNTSALLIALEECMAELLGKSEPQGFGERQRSGTLRVPEMLIGHQDAFDQTMRAIDARSHGLIIVQGAEGTGKTAFLRRLSTLISSRRMTLLVQCKMTHRSLPSQLLEELAKQLLYWPRHQVKQVQSLLSEADRHILMQHCTLLRSLFGKQPVVLRSEFPGGVVQSEQLDIANHALLHAVLQVQPRQLVLCIDDLDHRQMQHFVFLRRLLEDRSDPMRELTLVLSMNHANELTRHDGLDLGAHSALVVSLHPLTLAQTVSFIQATLSTRDTEFTHELADYIHPITQGVPLLTLHMLFMLHTTDAMVYARGDQGYAWRLDQDKITRIKLSDAMAEIVSKRLEALGDEVRELLELVASCKPAASLIVLDEAIEAPSSHTRARLDSACKMGLLMQTSPGQFQLLHELIERAITSRLSPERARHIHELLLEATRRALDTTLPEHSPHDRHVLRSQRAHHAMQLDLLGQGREALTLLMIDGWKSAIEHSDGSARFVVAHHLAEHHFDYIWSTSTSAALELTTSHTRDLFTHGEAGNATALLERAIEQAERHAPTMRRALIVNKVELLTLNAFYEQALMVALAELEQAGIDSIDASQAAALEEECEALLAQRSPSALLDVPHNQDEDQIQAAALLAAMLPLTYISEPDLFEPVVYTLTRFNLTHPHTPSASRGYSCYGQLAALHGDVHQALAFGQLAMDLADRFGDRRAHAIACSDMANYIAHWTRPLESMHELNMQSHREAIQAGDLQYAGYALMHDCYNRFFAQEPLKTLHEDTTKALARCYQLGNQMAIRVIEGLLILLEDFLLDAPAQTREDEFLAACVGESNRMAAALFSIGRSMVCYAHRDHVGAQRHFNRALHASRFIEGWFPLNELSAISQLTLSAQHMAMTRELHHTIPVPSTPASPLPPPQAPRP